MQVLVTVNIDKDLAEASRPSTAVMHALRGDDPVQVSARKIALTLLFSSPDLLPDCKRVLIDGSGHTVVDGPCARDNYLLAGLFAWEVENIDAAVARAISRVGDAPGRCEIEFRQLLGTDGADDRNMPGGDASAHTSGG